MHRPIPLRLLAGTRGCIELRLRQPEIGGTHQPWIGSGPDAESEEKRGGPPSATIAEQDIEVRHSAQACLISSIRRSISTYESSTGVARLVARGIAINQCFASEWLQRYLALGEDSFGMRGMELVPERPLLGPVRLALQFVAGPGLCGSQTRCEHAEWRAGYVVHSDLVAKFNGGRIPSVFAADSDLEMRPGFAAPLDSNLHQLSHPLTIDDGKGILLENALCQIRRQHLINVIP
jgi:hypothetical protein